MTQDIQVHHRGEHATPDAAESLVGEFVAATGQPVGLVAPFDGPLISTPRGWRLRETLWGWLAGPDAWCQWRVEGDCAAVSIVAVCPLSGLQLAVESAEAGEPVRLVLERAAARALPANAACWVTTYRRGGQPWLSRVEVRR